MQDAVVSEPAKVFRGRALRVGGGGIGRAGRAGRTRRAWTGGLCGGGRRVCIGLSLAVELGGEVSYPAHVGVEVVAVDVVVEG